MPCEECVGVADLLEHCRDAGAVRENVDLMVVVTSRYGLSPDYFGLFAELHRAWLLMQEGEVEQAISALSQLSRDDTIRQLGESYLAKAYLQAGRPEDALDAARRALASQYASDYRNGEAEAHRVLGEVLTHQAEPREAEAE
jgi:tetratricopeptide (TPR) repeat protein